MNPETIHIAELTAAARFARVLELTKSGVEHDLDTFTKDGLFCADLTIYPAVGSGMTLQEALAELNVAAYTAAKAARLTASPLRLRLGELATLTDKLVDGHPLPPRLDALIGFIEELRDHRPEVISGRRRDPQNDQDDLMPLGEFEAFQADAETLIGKRKAVAA